MNTSEPSNSIHPRHILAPVDFSRPSLHGLAAAMDLARRFRAKLTILHVVKHLPHGSHVVMDLAGIPQDWMRPARDRLAAFVTEHVPDDLSARQEVAVGKPFHEVVQIAVELNCDLIVVSTHGYTGLAHVLIGSNAERIVQHAPCPVLVVRGRPETDAPATSEATAFRWVLLPTDFSESAQKAILIGAAMARQFDARLILTHVRPALPGSGETALAFSDEELLAQRARIEDQLAKFRTDHLGAEPNTVAVLREGVPYQVICEMAAADEPGLIVLSTRGQTGWKHALMGSTAERVVRHAPCPVLVVK